MHDKMDRQHEDTHGKLDQLLDMVAQSEIQVEILQRQLPHARGHLTFADSRQDPVFTHATIPPEVPELPVALQTRPVLLTELKQRVLSQSQASTTTSLVGISRGAAATTSAHGMVHAHAHAHARAHTHKRIRTHTRTRVTDMRECVHACYTCRGAWGRRRRQCS